MLDAFISKYFSHPFIWPNTIEYRLYQKKIADAAFEKNTLVILPTALGKTVISAIVAANILYNYRGSKVLVMAPTRPLVLQHRKSFLKLLKLRLTDTLLLTGKVPPNIRSGIWESESRVIFSTPQVVRNDLVEKRLDLNKFGLLIFDECHRSVKNYAYASIAEYYTSQASYPLILGMTASPGSNFDRVHEVCKNLYIEQVEYKSEDDPDVKQYIQPINIEWHRVNLPKEYLKVKSEIWSILDGRLEWLYSMKIIKQRPKYVTKKILLDVGEELRFMLEDSIEEERGRLYTAIIFQSMALTLFHMIELLETQGLWTFRAFLEKIEQEKKEKRSYNILVNQKEYKKILSLIENSSIEHPKLLMLKKIVEEQIIKKSTSRMIIFTQYRETSSHIVTELNKIKNIKAERFVGQASRLGDKGLTQEEQADRIEDLESGLLNVLVATSIAEEGLDIPTVDHVIFYEPIPSEIRYIQRRGRTGRKSPGKVTILVTNDSLDIAYLYASKKRTEAMRRIAENVSKRLIPVIRKIPRPPSNPITLEEIKLIENESKNEDKIGSITFESDEFENFEKEVENKTKTLYLKLLEKGKNGANLRDLSSEMSLDDSLPVLKSAMNKIIKKGLVEKVNPDKYVVSSINKKEKLGKKYNIYIESIHLGEAIILIDDKWNAKLESQDYNGPRELIKKGSKFRAIGELYKMQGGLYLRVRDVIQTISKD